MRTAQYFAISIVVFGLAACASTPEPASTATGSTTPSASASPVATAPAVVETFVMPRLCADILPQSRLLSFIDEDLVLLGGPEGRYGDDYLLDSSPEQEAGGITCIWGESNSEISTVTVSVAPLRAAVRADIVDNLIHQGLNEDTDDSGSVFWMQGDSDHAPAIVNVLRSDSWISVIQTVGGPEAYAEAELIAGEVHDTVYQVG